MPAKPRTPASRSLALGRVAMFTTGGAWLGFVVVTIGRVFVSEGSRTIGFKVEAASYLLIVTLLTCSALAYLVSRQGFLHPTRNHR